MTHDQMKAISVLFFLITGSLWLGYGTNWMVGMATFCLMMAVAGMLDV